MYEAMYAMFAFMYEIEASVFGSQSIHHHNKKEQ